MKQTEMEVSRRDVLKGTGAALLAASALAFPAELAEAQAGKNEPDVLYGHGLVWNRDLPGVAGDLRLAFDLRVNMETGIGFGSASDAVHPEANLNFAISSFERQKAGKENLYIMKGVVTEASDPASVGLPVRILAETSGPATAVAIAVGEQAYAGAGLVVIAIIAILIGLLLPAVQKVR